MFGARKRVFIVIVMACVAIGTVFSAGNREVPAAEPDRIDGWRRRLGVDGDCPLIGSFGHIGAAHRLDLVLEALGELAGERDFRLVVAGSVDAALDLEAAAARAGIAKRVHWAGRVAAAGTAA